MGKLIERVERLFCFPYSVTGEGNDRAIEAMRAELDFQVLEFSSGDELNGWLIPPACEIVRAELWKEGRLVHDGRSSPLGVPAQSDSFEGELDWAELEPHIFVAELNDAVPYHWQRLYRPDTPLWGFCMSSQKRDTLQGGKFEVRLEVRKTPSTMKVMIYTLAGTDDETILINAHNCHPFQANDDTSGVATGIEVIQRLMAVKNRRYTYALMIAPELFGPMFWLSSIGSERAGKVVGALLLKSVGNASPLRLQQSFTGSASLDRAAHNVFRNRYETYDWGEFRTIYGNDETVFEAPPYSIPSVSLTRWPFPQYHTDADLPTFLSEAHLEDAVGAAFEICLALEADLRLRMAVEGLVCLSRHGLYKPIPNVGPAGVDYKSVDGRWNRLMNDFPRRLDGTTGLLEVAERYGLPVTEVRDYAMQWVSQGLAEEC